MGELRLYEFKAVRGPVLDKWIVERIISSRPGEEIKLAYPGITAIAVRGSDFVEFSIGGVVHRVDMSVLGRIRYSSKMYIVQGGILHPLEVRGRGYYKLLSLGLGKPPTLEINGIHMHRITGTDPWNDTLAKTRAARIKRGVRVLDVCTGLGYTAISSLNMGASSVLTVEVDEAVLYLAERNPWSWRLEDKRITIVNDDALRVIPQLQDDSFDRIIHDPPRFSSMTGDLYGIKFYRELYRVLKPGGVLFHYTGTPGRLRKLNLPGRVASRLERAGFMVRYYDGRALGVVAVKPR